MLALARKWLKERLLMITLRLEITYDSDFDIYREFPRAGERSYVTRPARVCAVRCSVRVARARDVTRAALVTKYKQQSIHNLTQIIPLKTHWVKSKFLMHYAFKMIRQIKLRGSP